MKGSKFFKKILIVLALLVVVMCLVYYFAFLDIQKRNTHASQMQNDLNLQVKKDEYMQSVELTVTNASSTIQQINDSIVGQDDNVEFIEFLENTAKFNKLNITISSLTIDDVAPLSKTNMTTLDVKAVTSGSWANTYVFLKELESLPYNITVDNLDLTSLSDVPEDSQNGASAKIWQSAFEIHVLKYK